MLIALDRFASVQTGADQHRERDRDCGEQVQGVVSIGLPRCDDRLANLVGDGDGVGGVADTGRCRQGALDALPDGQVMCFYVGGDLGRDDACDAEFEGAFSMSICAVDVLHIEVVVWGWWR